MSKDYYKILGISKNATKEEIKKAYKNLAKKYHPDVNKDADTSEKFKEINEAASVLGDDQKRQQYDQFGAEGMGQQFSDFDFSGFGMNFGDIFDQMFSGFAFGRRGAQPGRGLLVEQELTLTEVAEGVTKKIKLRRQRNCNECHAAGGTHVKTCDTCEGRGMVRQAKRTPFGVFATTSPCRACGGRGEKPEKECKTCGGDGRVIVNSPVEVKIPAGVHEGMRVRVEGEGEAGEHGARTGDLYVLIHVERDDRFQREGADLHASLPLGFITAILGGEVEVETIDGKERIKISSGTQNGEEITLKGKGLAEVRRRGKGDIVYHVDIQVPKKISKKQKELLESFSKEGGKKKFGLF